MNYIFIKLWKNKKLNKINIIHIIIKIMPNPLLINLDVLCFFANVASTYFDKEINVSVKIFIALNMTNGFETVDELSKSKE